MGSESHCAIFRSIGATVFELSPGPFLYKVILQHFLLRPTTPPLFNFSDVKLLFPDSKLYIEYEWWKNRSRARVKMQGYLIAFSRRTLAQPRKNFEYPRA